MPTLFNPALDKPALKNFCLLNKSARCLSIRLVTLLLTLLACGGWNFALSENLKPAPPFDTAYNTMSSECPPAILHERFKQITGLEHAHAVLLLDVSSSTSLTVQMGPLQALLNRLAPIIFAMTATDSIETWQYATRFERLPELNDRDLSFFVYGYIVQPIEVRRANNQKFNKIVPGLPLGTLLSSGHSVGSGNHEKDIMDTIVDEYGKGTDTVMVFVVTDAGVALKGVKQVCESTKSGPIFWQFVQFSGATKTVSRTARMLNFGADKDKKKLEQSLKDLPNADYLDLDNFERFSNSEIETSLLAKFSKFNQEREAFTNQPTR